MLTDILTAIRPYQWYKNLVLFAGLVFAGDLFVFPLFVRACAAFFIFCLISGAGYLVNDLADRTADALHPRKAERPIASGALSPWCAVLLSLFLFVAANGSALLLSVEFGLCAVLYTAVTVLYSVILKRKVLVDVISISVGFVIRAVAGAVVINVYISPWLILCAFMLALFLALAKRRKDRSPLYEPQFLDHLLSVTTTLVIMSYSLYTFLRASQEMMVTIPLVLYGLFRFLQLSYEEKEISARVELFFLDKGLFFTSLVWVLLVVVIIYVVE
ncbi:MAG: UbiA prenyltransferase family protein [Theionarchaea archaeon]|nr:MAG: hypothetical protein AYK18_05000 [Theionarchaea archaeon DG-70]MBU7009523.1 UbiA prenyltransferase family protein [Theionarchaea archaeon]